MFDNIGTTIETGLNNYLGAWLGQQTAAVTAQTLPQPTPATVAPAPAKIFGLSPLMLGMSVTALVGLVIVSRA